VKEIAPALCSCAIRAIRRFSTFFSRSSFSSFISWIALSRSASKLCKRRTSVNRPLPISNANSNKSRRACDQYQHNGGPYYRVQRANQNGITRETYTHQHHPLYGRRFSRAGIGRPRRCPSPLPYEYVLYARHCVEGRTEAVEARYERRSALAGQRTFVFPKLVLVLASQPNLGANENKEVKKARARETRTQRPTPHPRGVARAKGGKHVVRSGPEPKVVSSPSTTRVHRSAVERKKPISIANERETGEK
jgi:hypothetical protein